jgi:pyridoxine/pyridoxamine 5'-phosphate oxidase
MTLEEAFAIIRSKRFLVVSSVDGSGAPEAALVGFALTEGNEFVFDTFGSTRKAVNFARNPRTALVVGWDDGISIQVEGEARRPAGDDLAALKAAYFSVWPDGRQRETWPDIAYIAIKPRWLRYSNYAGEKGPDVQEFTL